MKFLSVINLLGYDNQYSIEFICWDEICKSIVKQNHYMFKYFVAKNDTDHLQT